MIREKLIKLLTPKNSTFGNPDDWMWDAFAGRPVASGERVNETNALQLSAVWACVRAISEGVSSLPLNVYRSRRDGGKDKLDRHPINILLHDAPNPDMTSMVFRETLMAHVLTWGNGYAEIVRDGVGRPVELWPMNPSGMTPKRTDSGQLYYEFRDDSGEVTELQPSSVLHIPGLGFDGVTGYSPIRMAREGLGLTSASEKFGASLFGNGAIAGGVLEHPGKLGDEAFKHLAKSMDSHKGSSNAHKTMILEEGMKWSQTSIAPDDAQFLETRKFQTAEIARWFNVPLHKIKDLDKATFSNIEQQSIEFVVDTIRPWLVRWEQEIKRKLFRSTERDMFAEHKVDALLRGDIKARYEAYAVGRGNGWLSANDIRSLENMNPIDDGDLYLVPLNMTTPDKVGQDAPMPDNAVVQALLANAARNIATKEVNALKRAMNKDDFKSFALEFFTNQAKNRAEMLHIPLDIAEKDTQNAMELLDEGLDGWINNRVGSLIKLAEEVHNGDS